MKCPNCKNPVSDNTASCEWCGEILAFKNENINHINKLDAEMIELVKAGKKLEAVKEYKERTGLGLKESKDYIDKISINIPQNLSVAQKKGGCMSIILLLIIISSSIIGLFQII